MRIRERRPPARRADLERTAFVLLGIGTAFAAIAMALGPDAGGIDLVFGGLGAGTLLAAFRTFHAAIPDVEDRLRPIEHYEDAFD